jgi:hypothetical protein
MQASPTELLAAWELGLNQTPVQRALTLLSISLDGTRSDEQETLTIGECDRRLLRLHERAFGSRIRAIACCPACGEKLELNFDVADVYIPQTAEIPASLTIEKHDFVVTFRLPRTVDLMALNKNSTSLENRKCLLERCILNARRARENLSVHSLPEDIVTEVSAQMVKADPQAEVLIAARCPDCTHFWKVPLDIGTFVWTELNVWAIRLLREIHLLAAAYSWSESEILALSPTRRQLYLEMLER